MSLQVAVLADDLSGGNAVGAEFARCGFHTLLLHSAEETVNSCELPDVLVVNTATRNLEAESARTINIKVAESIRSHKPRFVVKKIDSLLRGPIPAEIDAVADAFGFTRGLIVPASPKSGRTTVDGRQRVGPDPLLKALARFDPTARLPTDEVPVLLSTSRRSIGRLRLEAVRGGRDAITEGLASEIDKAFIVADCETQHDLCAVVEAAAGAGIDYFVGSYGLGEALIQVLTRARNRLPSVAIAGSLSEATRRQVAYLRNDPRCYLISLCPSRADAHGVPCEALEQARAALARGQDLIIYTTPSLEFTGASDDRESAAAVEKSLTSLLRPLLPSISALAISGGATAEAILDALDARGFLLTAHELMPGVPLAHVYGGRWNGLPCVTKPGSFGGDDALAEILSFFRSYPTRATLPAQEGGDKFQPSVEE